MKGVFTIGIDRHFADELATGVRPSMARPLALADTLILPPTRRSVRALREAFPAPPAESLRSCRDWLPLAMSTRATG
jgi:hypothetical protein